MGMAEATALEEAVAVSIGGDGEDTPVGDAIDEGKMKSSMFIGSASEVLGPSWDDSRNLAIPDGALVV